jgi:hypothetical protein
MSESMSENVPDRDAPSLRPKGGFSPAPAERHTVNPPPIPQAHTVNPRLLQMHQAASVNQCPIYALYLAMLFICNTVWGIPYVHNLMQITHLT